MIKITPNLTLCLITIQFFIIDLSQAHNLCIPSPLLEEIISNITIYQNSSLVNVNFLNCNSTLSSVYNNISNIGCYKIQIQEKYKIYIGSSPSKFTSDTNEITADPSILSGFNANTDIWLKFPSGLITINCNLFWSIKIGCGTYVEVHLPYYQSIITKIKINNLSEIINMAIQELCAGVYHIWLIYETRIGKVVKGVRQLVVSQPFCSC